jgi:hypothetical protein
MVALQLLELLIIQFLTSYCYFLFLDPNVVVSNIYSKLPESNFFLCRKSQGLTLNIN